MGKTLKPISNPTYNYIIAPLRSESIKKKDQYYPSQRSLKPSPCNNSFQLPKLPPLLSKTPLLRLYPFPDFPPTARMARERGGRGEGVSRARRSGGKWLPSSSLNAIPNTDERIPRRADFNRADSRTRLRRRLERRGCDCVRRTHTIGRAQGGKDSRGRPEGLSEVRTVHYPRSRTPLRLLDSFPLVHRPRPSSTDPRAPSASASLALLPRSIIIFTHLEPRRGATHRSFFFPFLERSHVA